MSEQPGDRLLVLLNDIKAVDIEHTDYQARYSRVLQAVAEADRIGLAAGFRLDPTEPEWPVAYIELPTGQVSWHMPQHKNAWDGHDTAEKYERIEAYQIAVFNAGLRGRRA